jgi:hypothetical protein
MPLISHIMPLDSLVEVQSKDVVVVADVAGNDHNVNFPRDMVVLPGNILTVRTTVHGEVEEHNIWVKTDRPVGAVTILKMNLLYHVSYLNNSRPHSTQFSYKAVTPSRPDILIRSRTNSKMTSQVAVFSRAFHHRLMDHHQADLTWEAHLLCQLILNLDVALAIIKVEGALQS